LPEGLSFDSRPALISGIPQKLQDAAFKVKITDTKQNYDIAELIIHVNEEPLGIIGGSLAQGTVGASYYSPLYAKGGTPPYQWQTTTLLPSGLTLNKSSGSISGIPMESAYLLLDITVSDACENKAFAKSPASVYKSYKWWQAR